MTHEEAVERLIQLAFDGKIPDTKAQRLIGFLTAGERLAPLIWKSRWYRTQQDLRELGVVCEFKDYPEADP